MRAIPKYTLDKDASITFRIPKSIKRGLIKMAKDKDEPLSNIVRKIVSREVRKAK